MKKLEKMLWEGIHGNDLRKVAWALNLGLGVEAELNGYSPLSLAVLRGNVEVAELLISAGANVNTKDNMGELPLYWAVWMGNIALAEYLISAGADVNAKNNDGESPLSLATLWDKVEMKSLLKKHGAVK